MAFLAMMNKTCKNNYFAFAAICALLISALELMLSSEGSQNDMHAMYTDLSCALLGAVAFLIVAQLAKWRVIARPRPIRPRIASTRQANADMPHDKRAAARLAPVLLGYTGLRDDALGKKTMGSHREDAITDAKNNELLAYAVGHSHETARALSEELARLVKGEVEKSIVGAEVVGFSCGGIEIGTPLNSVVPNIDVVVTAPVDVNSKLTHGAAFVRRLQMVSIEACISRLKAVEGFTFSKMVYDLNEPVAVFVARPSLGVYGEAVPFNLSVNTATPLYASTLFNQVREVDARAGELMCLVRHWVKARGICNPRNGHLAQYGWLQLVVFFMQVSRQRGEGSVLPRIGKFLQGGTSLLQQAAGEEKLPPSPLETLPQSPLEQAIVGKERWSSAADCFKDFVDFYTNEMQWTEEAVSARLGVRAPPSEGLRVHAVRSDSTSKVAPTIEDPFEPWRNLGGDMMFTGIKVFFEEIARADKLCKQGLPLDVIMKPKPKIST